MSFNYIRAMDDGPAQISSGLFSLEILQEIHHILLKGTRGGKDEEGYTAFCP